MTRALNEETKERYQLAGAYLAGLRKKAGYTQRELSRLVDMPTEPTMSHIERGNTTLPPSKWKASAKAFGVPVRALSRQLLGYYQPEVWTLLFTGDL